MLIQLSPLERHWHGLKKNGLIMIVSGTKMKGLTRLNLIFFNIKPNRPDLIYSKAQLGLELLVISPMSLEALNFQGH